MSANIMRRGVVVAAVMLAAISAPVVPATAQNATWSTESPLPVARSEMKAAVVNGKIYLIGGAFDEMQGTEAVTNYTSGLTTEYDPVAKTWRERARAPAGSTHQALAVLDGKIYALGGFGNSRHTEPSQNFFRYDPATDSWETLPAIPTGPQGGGVAAAVDGKIHAIGGRVTENEVFATHLVFDPAANAWSEAAPLPTARDHASSFVVDGKIHVVGGRLGETEVNVGTHDIYDPATDTWTSGPEMPTGRSSLAYDVYNGMLFVAGGECRVDPRGTFDEVEAFDVANGRWIEFPALPVGRHAFASAAIGGKLYFFGGSTNCGGGGKVDETLVLTMP
jgi:N-acetylneuraminic acid mutarotase